MSKVFGPLTLALALSAFSAMPARATIQSGRVECGLNQCVETWQFTCTGSTVVIGTVIDTAGADDSLMLTMIATAPTKFKGNSEAEIATPGFKSGPVAVGQFFQPNTSISGLAIVTNLSDTGAANYDLNLFCVETDGPVHDPRVFKLLQNE
jgi:hypothetical protein